MGSTLAGPFDGMMSGPAPVLARLPGAVQAQTATIPVWSATLMADQARADLGGSNGNEGSMASCASSRNPTDDDFVDVMPLLFLSWREMAW